MNTKFTKGEWRVDGGNDIFDIMTGNHTVVNWIGFDDVDFNIDKEESKANAHLIAAAPDMYAMIEDLASELHQAIDECNDQRLSRVTSQTETPPDLWDMQSLHEAQLLLKKARGE